MDGLGAVCGSPESSTWKKTVLEIRDEEFWSYIDLGLHPGSDTYLQAL